MIEPFIMRAVLAGLAAAALTAPLGAVLIWRRAAIAGDALAHSALLGVALALFMGIAPIAGVGLVAALMALAVFMARSSHSLPVDARLGVFAHAALAAGLIFIAFTMPAQGDVMGLLFGDILALSAFDVWLTGTGALVLLGVLALVWRPLLAAAVSEEIAIAEGLDPRRAVLVHMLLLAAALALAMKITGALLFTSLLLIPAAAARAVARSPEAMAAWAALLGMLAVVIGLWGSWKWDAPSGPSIVMAAFALFAVMQTAAALRR